MSLKKQIFLTLFLLFGSIILFGISSIDINLQDNFYDASSKKWILDRNLEPYKFLFYDGIKRLLIIFAISVLLSLIFLRKKKIILKYKKGLLIVILSAILIPISVGGLKKITNMPCPKNEIHYHGLYPSTKVWESYPNTFKQSSKLQCYPAGHASGGFALLSLFFLFKSRKNKTIALLTALTIAWPMGLYKMFIGDHFFSHTLITMLLAWLIILLNALFINKFIKNS